MERLLLRAAAALPLAAVAVTAHDLVASVHCVEADVAPSLRGLAPRDWVLVSRLALRLEEHRRGDVVLVHAPDAPREERLVAMRALPGDWLPGGGYERVPAGRAWVVAADTEAGAPRDSAHGWGALPLALVQGRATHVVWPPGRMRALPRTSDVSSQQRF
jgi:inner membrane protease subunit 2